jgi:hypothetical protein
MFLLVILTASVISNKILVLLQRRHRDTQFQHVPSERDLTYSLSFRWYKFLESNNNKKLVKLDDRVKQVGGTLIIKEAKVDDSGKYLCMVNNSVGGESVETVLTVTGTE